MRTEWRNCAILSVLTALIAMGCMPESSNDDDDDDDGAGGAAMAAGGQAMGAGGQAMGGGGQAMAGGGQAMAGGGQAMPGGEMEMMPPDSEGLPEGCVYPEAGPIIGPAAVIPRLKWADAVNADGEQVGLDMGQVFCKVGEFANVETVAFIIGAGWCGYCPDNFRRVAGLADDIYANNGMIVWVETQDNARQPIDSRHANRALSEYLGDAPGYRVGDLTTEPMMGMINDSPLVTGYPSGFVVRTSDMKVIAEEASSQTYLDLVAISGNPERDWGSRELVFNCEPEQEEATEPNNDVTNAVAIEPGTFSGGICGLDKDFFQVNIQGAWQVDLRFQHAGDSYDLDIAVWDPNTNQPLRTGAGFVGSESVDDNESFQYQGPAVVAVYGYGYASAPYEFELTAL